jgi:hypothetical protein
LMIITVELPTMSQFHERFTKGPAKLENFP